ncbi:MAG: hypothetical protein IJC09_04170 [Clostridia bacterium]|nr:hypothetical protein [Clostridia bacterium]
MIEATKEFLAQQEELYAKRKAEILNAKDELVIKGTTYYVSNSGDDNADGKSPETAWKTIDRVNHSWFYPGDGVLFKRGDLWRGKAVETMPGVSYGAYGTGEKPKFYGWIEDMADASLWELVDADHNIWKYTKEITDPGTLVFNEGEQHSRKLIPSFRNLQFVCREDESKPFVMENEMTQDLDIYWYFDKILLQGTSKGETFPIPATSSQAECLGDLYLRCDKGNPGELFDSIEAIARHNAFRVRENANVTIDNICMKYLCFGVTAGGYSVGLHVTNCEIGWIGGNIQTYNGGDPNYPQGTRGSVTRFGNGIEIYGGCDDYVVESNYIYEGYDAGASHQVTTSKELIMQNIRYTDNLIEKCVYGIEYFLDQKPGSEGSTMRNLVMNGNIIRLSGYGWGQQRHNTDTPALIKGWSYTNTASDYHIYDNIFDRSGYRMLHLVAEKDEYCPEMHDNTYIQDIGGMIGQWGGNEVKEPDIEIFDENAEEKIKTVFREKNPKVYIIK